MNSATSGSRIFPVAVAVLAAAVTLGAARDCGGAIADCHDATCRITTADGSMGSGCVFEIGQGYVYVLTAAHVVGRYPTVWSEFWRQGHQSRPMAGEVLFRVEDDHCDAAVVAVPQSQFEGLLPRAVPVGPRSLALTPGTTVTSVGCAHGAWSTGWTGHVLGYQEGDLHFVPTPADGRSGSAIFDAEGRQIVGLLRARMVDGSEGIACSLESLYAGLGQATAERRTQCGPGGCPVPPSPSRQYVLPYREKQEDRFRQRTPWPTLPPSAPELQDTNRKLDKITDVVVDIRNSHASPAAQEPSKLQVSPLGLALTVLGALVVGVVVFYATQNHSPIE